MRSLRIDAGNSFFAATHALTPTATATMAYCKASEASIAQPAPSTRATW